MKKLDSDEIINISFGWCYLLKNGDHVWEQDDEAIWEHDGEGEIQWDRVKDIEAIAAQDPTARYLLVRVCWIGDRVQIKEKTMDELLQQLETMGLKHCTVIGSAPNRKGVGFYTHIAPKGSSFDPYVSPVFGETAYESLKEAITEWKTSQDYTVEMINFLAAAGTFD